MVVLGHLYYIYMVIGSFGRVCFGVGEEGELGEEEIISLNC